MGFYQTTQHQAYSSIRNETEITKDALAMSVYPNPASTNLTVALTATKTGNYIIELRDANGKLMISKQTSLQKIGSSININVAPYATGIYYISLSDKKGNIISKRVMITK